MSESESTLYERLLSGWLGANERRFSAAAKANGDLEIEVLDVIGSGFFFEGITAKSIQRTLKANPNAKTIRVLINSPGGSAFDGIAIKNLLEAHSARVEVEVLGWAASAASVIAMAGDSIKMREGSMMMIHRAWSFAIGDSEAMQAEADALTKLDESILDIYTRRTAGDRTEIQELVRKETWMTAGEAVERGFADEVLVGKGPAEDGAQNRGAPSAALLGSLGTHVMPNLAETDESELRRELARRERARANNHFARGVPKPTPAPALAKILGYGDPL